MAPRIRRRITTAKREEIEKEQQLLDKTIVRPFEKLENLPISYNEPPYGHYEDILKNPLSIKDSAVLYNSLIRSRKNYVLHAPMFKLHWVKQTAYAKKLAEMDKEKQNEILRDRENKRRFAKATTNSLEARSRIPVLSPEVNARDVMSKLCESAITLGPHTMDIRIFIAKDARSDKSKALSEISKVGGPPSSSPPLQAPALAMSAPPTASYGQPPITANPIGVPPAADAKAGGNGLAAPSKEAPLQEPAKAADIPPKSPAKSPTKPASQKGVAKPAEKKNPTSKAAEGKGSGKRKGDKKEEQEELLKNKQEPADKTEESSKDQETSEKADKAAEPAKAPAVPRPPPANLQSIDNTIMISNLNAIAKIDLSLNDLMKEVALGKASEAQITLFKKYIERAKQMGPQPHHADLYFSRGLPLPPNFPRAIMPGQFVDRRPFARPKLHNPMKLTAFQERYLHNATLVFEFLENPNVRYIIPQDSISEILPPELPPPADAEEEMEYNDVLFSHLWIHNIDQMEQYEKELAEYEAEIKRIKDEEEAEEKRKKEEAEMLERGETPPVKDEPRTTRGKKKAPPPRKKKLSAPELPSIKYSAISFTVHNVPTKFVPIFSNSMRPLKQVQEKMERILKTGVRVPTNYLWYQVDARLDEVFAENLRNAAVNEEKQMTGYMPPVEPRKRKPKDPRTSRPKRSKESSPAGYNGGMGSVGPKVETAV